MKLKTVPHRLLFIRASAKFVIEKDVARWIEIYNPARFSEPMLENLTWLLENYPEFRNLFYYRLGYYSGLMGQFLLKVAKIFLKPLDSLWFPNPTLGPGLFIECGLGSIIGGTLGASCWITNEITVGYKDDQSGLPTIGDNVYIGAGARILGPVRVGDNVKVGANAVVLKDVPSNSTVVGVPAHLVQCEENHMTVLSPLSEMACTPRSIRK